MATQRENQLRKIETQRSNSLKRIEETKSSMTVQTKLQVPTSRQKSAYNNSIIEDDEMSGRSLKHSKSEHSFDGNIPDPIICNGETSLWMSKEIFRKASSIGKI